MLRISAALALLLLAGCHRERISEVQFTLTPAGDTVTAACTRSSSGDCYFAFTGTTVNVKEGQTVTVGNVAAGSLYCADSHAVRLETCKTETVGWKRATVTKRTASAGPTG